MSNQKVEYIFGEPGRGDYSHGDKITFREQGKEYIGEVSHCSAPYQTVRGIQLHNFTTPLPIFG